MTVKKTFSVTCFTTEAIQGGTEPITDEHRILEAFLEKEATFASTTKNHTSIETLVEKVSIELSTVGKKLPKSQFEV